MKNLFVSAAVLCFSAVTMAQVVTNPTLNLEGSFGKRTTGVIHAAKDAKSCKARGGYTHKDKCLVTSTQDSVKIEKIDSSSYIVKVVMKTAKQPTMSFDLLAVKRNAVQLISNQGTCDVIVGFENQSTVSIFTEGDCSSIGLNNFKLNQAKRLAVAKRK